MKIVKKPSQTIVTNRGVGDKRIRDLEIMVNRLNATVGGILDVLAGEGDAGSPIEFVEEVPEDADPNVIYAVYEDDETEQPDQGYELNPGDEPAPSNEDPSEEK